MSKNLVSSQSHEPDNLFAAGVAPVVTAEVTLKAGVVYERGTVLGIIKASDLTVKVDSSAEDGSENPYAVLADDVDATEEDTKAAAYLTGNYNAAALKFGGTDTIETHKQALRDIGIFAESVQG